MSAGEVAGLVAALALVVLVALVAVPLLRLARTLEDARRAIALITDEAVPALRETRAAAASVRAGAGRAEGIDADLAEAAHNAQAISSLVASAVTGPAVKVSALGYGVRRALEHRRAASARGRREETLARVRARREERLRRGQGRGRGAA
ncbi:DUF948 domain-containing protein [Vallicoccus soli]|nr:DUF948 domain-containing protein [Vallicoccus soli]